MDRFEETGPPFEVDHFSRSDRSDFWLNGSRPIEFWTEISGISRLRYQEARTADRAFANFVASHRTLGVLREKMASSSNQEEGKASRKHGFYVDDCFTDTLK